MNILGQESIVFLLNCLDRLPLLRDLDLSYVIEESFKSKYHKMIQEGLNRKSDNFVVKVLSHYALKNQMNPCLLKMSL